MTRWYDLLVFMVIFNASLAAVPTFGIVNVRPVQPFGALGVGAVASAGGCSVGQNSAACAQAKSSVSGILTTLVSAFGAFIVAFLDFINFAATMVFPYAILTQLGIPSSIAAIYQAGVTVTYIIALLALLRGMILTE